MRTLIGLLAVIVAAPALALDPECDPSLPQYKAHDLAEDYVRPGRRIRYCTSMSNAPDPVTCTVTIAGIEVQPPTPRAPGSLVEVIALDAGPGPPVITCEVAGLDGGGQPTTYAGTVTAVYDPIPVVEPPVPLD